MTLMNKTTVLIPTLNEAHGIEPTIREVVQEIGHAEIIVVDSRSTDGTAQIASKLGVKVITHSGRGKGRAFAIVLPHISRDTDWLVITDGDYSYPSTYVPKMIEILEKNPDLGMVAGMPHLPYVQKYTLWKRLKWIYLGPYSISHRILTILHQILNGVNMQAPLTGQRVIRHICFKDFQPKSAGFDIEVEINSYIRKQGYKILEIPVKVRYRIGEAKFHRLRHLLVILRRIVIESMT